MSSPRVDAAIERAREAARSPVRAPSLDGRPRMRRLAIGDPQAPLRRYLELLDTHGALGDAGWIHEDVHILSLGDHFDWGPPAVRAQATREGLELLAWLAGHPTDQVTILLGNHDLARVGELSSYDDAAYLRAREDADRAYRSPDPARPALEAEFLVAHPEAPTAESVARDHSCFCVAQRALVTELLRAGRMKLAHAEARDLFFVHAGVTTAELEALGLSARERVDAFVIAEAIGEHLTNRVAAWRDGPLDLAPLQVPGSRAFGESRGVVSHRPAYATPETRALFDGPPRRRFDPRTLPLGVTQVIGHIRDSKCRVLLGPWVADEGGPEGPLRTLGTDGREAAYRAGLFPRGAGEAQLVFADGGLQHTEIEAYEIFDVASRAPARPGSRRPASAKQSSA